MSTITPTTGQEKNIFGASFVVGDLVLSLETGLGGKVLETNVGGVVTQVLVQWYGGSVRVSSVSVLRLRRGQ